MKMSRTVTVVGGVALCGSSPSMAQGPQVAVRGGALAGVEADGVIAFKGIPYAAPPVGPLRWRAPQPAAAWAGVRSARDYGHDCIQNYTGFQPRGSEPAEDCLFLNVWRPASTAKKLPVLVWIYGGGFVNGSSSRPIYDGSRLARQGIMVVSLNYRLGRFGTFAHPALTRANEDRRPTANFGYMDQIAAMNWIVRNVAAFGGDASNVTIMGESAGGMSVHNLMTSPMARGLFQRAIIESGGDAAGIGTKTLADAEAVGIKFAQTQNIAADDSAAVVKLRALPAAAVLGDIKLGSMVRDGQRTFSSPFPDGTVAVDAREAYRTGAYQRVPVIIGATSGDMGGRDGMMIKGARTLANLISASGVPTYYYRFSYVAEAAPTPKSDGAIHADDLPYYFNTVDVKYGAATNPADKRMGGVVSSYIVNFVKTGNPNGGTLPFWPKYHADGAMMDFSVSGTAVTKSDPWRNADPAKAVIKPAVISPSAG